MFNKNPGGGELYFEPFEVFLLLIKAIDKILRINDNVKNNHMIKN